MDFNCKLEQFKEMNAIKEKLAVFMNENKLAIRYANGNIVIEYDYYKDGEPIVLFAKEQINPEDLI